MIETPEFDVSSGPLEYEGVLRFVDSFPKFADFSKYIETVSQDETLLLSSIEYEKELIYELEGISDYLKEKFWRDSHKYYQDKNIEVGIWNMRDTFLFLWIGNFLSTLSFPVSPAPESLYGCDEIWNGIKNKILELVIEMWDKTEGRVDLRELVYSQYMFMLSEAVVENLNRIYTNVVQE